MEMNRQERKVRRAVINYGRAYTGSDSSSTTGTAAGGGVTFLSLLFLLFLGLKLTGNIDWSWWLVTAPLWAPWFILIGVFFIGALLYLVFSLLEVLVLWLYHKTNHYKNRGERHTAAMRSWVEAYRLEREAREEMRRKRLFPEDTDN